MNGTVFQGLFKFYLYIFSRFARIRSFRLKSYSLGTSGGFEDGDAALQSVGFADGGAPMSDPSISTAATAVAKVTSLSGPQPSCRRFSLALVTHFEFCYACLVSRLCCKGCVVKIKFFSCFSMRLKFCSECL